MRKNFPITQHEVMLAERRTIVSTTDLKGRITYANPYFLEVSGFALDEVIGAPQNIVRHPDMPPEAFADLWATIGSGRPWSGMVKNRCKNG
uniref:PAS domain-containing protein n=1 Tax=uncultured Massilia sp. TaxID=169973 RepID=UPI0025F4447F